jgi:WD40 repeat protein
VTDFRPNKPASAKVGASDYEVEWIAIAPDASFVATSRGTFELPSLKKGAKIDGGPIALSPDGTTLARVARSALELIDSRTGRVRTKSQITSGELHGLAFSPDGTRIAVGEYERFFVCDAKTARVVTKIPAFDRVVKRVAWSPDGKTIAAQSYDDVGVFDATSGRRIAKLAGVESDASLRGQGALVFMHDGRLIATMDAKTIGVWDRRKGGKPRVTLEQKWFTYAVATHPELVVIGNVLELELYTPALKRVGKIKLPDGLYSVAISRDAKTICAGTYGKLLVWKRK